MKSIKIASWNVNGIRSLLTKTKTGIKHNEFNYNNSLSVFIDEQQPDIICLQEIRCSQDFDIGKYLNIQNKGYKIISQNCSKSKKGYSGTLVISRLDHEDVIYDFPHLTALHELNQEGRLITVEFSKFVLINSYVPNAKPDLSRLDFRIKEWETNLREHINAMKIKYSKPIIACADWNVAPEDIDVHNPKTAKGKHGFTAEEKTAFKKLLKDCDLINSFRFLYPSKVMYTWWSNFAKSREKNKGWLIDMFLVSSSISKKIKDAFIYNEYMGSDHCPIALEINL